MNNSDEIQAIRKFLVFIVLILLIIFIFRQIIALGWMDVIEDRNKLFTLIQGAGLIGPVLIIGLITIAIVISPIPSAPIALVSGALYGHTLGTIYIVIGAVTGAVIAFIIARYLGHDYVNKKLHYHLPVKLVGSQNSLMIIVFLTRLAPFLSFDVLSYAAGLTSLTLLRFFLATVAGIIPISFMLAHLGSEVKDGEMKSIAFALILLGFMTIIPVIFNKIKRTDIGS